VIQEVIVSLQG